jgi:vacuolar-type H+-ATPase subunit D/Vma8
MSVPRQDCDSTIDLLNLSRDQLIKRVLALMRENERLQGEIRRSTDEVADLQFQLLRYQTPALTGVDARCATSSFLQIL